MLDRQGDVPPRQVLRRRSDDPRPPRARVARLPAVDGGRLVRRRRRRGCAPRTGARCACRSPAATACTPRSRPRVQLDAALVALAAEPAPRCAPVSASPHLERQTADRPATVVLDDGSRARRPPCRRRRRGVEPRRKCDRPGHDRATSASGTPSVSTSGWCHGSGRRAAVRVVRTRSASRLRVVVPTARWTCQPRLRRAPRRRTHGPGDQGTVGRADRPPPHPRARSVLVPSARHATRPGRSRPAIDRAVLDDGEVLFVGDAAAASDVLTGEGIGQALLTGRLAAEAIESSPGDGRDGGTHYAAAVRRELVADHRMSALLGRVLATAAAPTGRWRSSPTADVGAAQLRPVDVRGRAAGAVADPSSLAPRHSRPARRVHCRRRSESGIA